MAKRVQHIPAAAGRQVIELGGEKLALCYDFQAIGLFEQITGINLLDDWIPGKLTAIQVATFAWAGCHRYQPGKEWQWFMDQLNFDNYAGVMNQLLQAFSKSLPEPKQGPLEPVSETPSA